MPSAVPSGMMPSRIRAGTGNGASAAKRSRGSRSFTWIRQALSARRTGRNGTAGGVPKRDGSPYSMLPGSTAFRYVWRCCITSGLLAASFTGTSTPAAASPSSTDVNRPNCQSR